MRDAVRRLADAGDARVLRELHASEALPTACAPGVQRGGSSLAGGRKRHGRPCLGAAPALHARHARLTMGCSSASRGSGAQNQSSFGSLPVSAARARMNPNLATLSRRSADTSSDSSTASCTAAPKAATYQPYAAAATPVPAGIRAASMMEADLGRPYRAPDRRWCCLRRDGGCSAAQCTEAAPCAYARVQPASARSWTRMQCWEAVKQGAGPWGRAGSGRGRSVRGLVHGS